MAGGEPEKGDKVSWNWGGGAPGGTVAEKKKEGEVAITSKRGNKIKKNAEPDDPAVHIERSGNDVVKKASELNVEKKGSGKSSGGESKENGEKGGDQAGDKRKHEDGEDDKDDDPHVKNNEGKEVKPGGKAANKKQKQEKEDKDEKKATNGEKKKPGRPKGSGESKKSKKDPAPRKQGDLVSTRTRSQGKK